MSKPVSTVVVVGGGTAGWLTAGLIAAEHRPRHNTDLQVVLVESPDIKPIGVGEGTWPTMRASLQTMGVSETDFIRQCDASFKQGTKFNGWLHGKNEFYYHPFALPEHFHEVDLTRHWQTSQDNIAFAEAVTPQVFMCENAKAPKQITTPEYASNLNYGYHLDAGKFATFLQSHCVRKLGVVHVLDNVTSVSSYENGDIECINLASGKSISGDLFVDCTGFSALLLNKHFQIPFVSVQKYLFNDSALAVQIPRTSKKQLIASTTQATAQSAGWIWDIALPTRRGVGYVYSSQFIDKNNAESELREYLATTDSQLAQSCELRNIKFNPGYRETLWYKNCVGVGLSAGFVEPLEASALVLVELSAKIIAEQLPANRDSMDVVASRFNKKLLYHWQRIVEFLKLHYVLSERTDSAYWQKQRAPKSIPKELQDSLKLWQHRSPRFYDLPLADELFPAASYSYVLNGMGFKTQSAGSLRQSDLATRDKARRVFGEAKKRQAQMLQALPTNNQLIDKVHEFGFQKI